MWKWFLGNEQAIIDAVKNEQATDYLIENLDNLVLDLGVFTWEIGAGKSKPWSFTISPNGDRDLLEVSQKIMEQAPDLDHWEFNNCKPPKDWDRRFSIYDDNMDEQAIDASSWKYAALRSDDGMIELILEAGNVEHLDHDTTNTAANLVVLNELGEEIKIKRISSVVIVDQLDPEYSTKKNDIRHLRAHLLSL